MTVGGRLFAACYDRLAAGAEAAGLSAHRESLLSGAAGRVLEIGAGTGANLRFYGDAVESLTVTEPELPMARKLERRIGEQSRRVNLVRAPAERLSFANGEFDVVVSTLVLCTVDDQARVLKELRRVLEPEGRLLFIEHVRSEDPRRARWQDRLNRVNQVIAHGCNCNRSTLAAIEAAGFTITELERDELKKVPPMMRPLAIGTASAGPS